MQSGTWKSEPRCNLSAVDLTNWVKEGVATNPTTDFQTDGVMYLYSTLHPETGVAGALKLVAIDGNVWTGSVLIGLLVLGFVFLFRSVQAKVVLVAAFAAILIAIGAFSPTFASQMLSSSALVGGLLVLVLWVTREILHGMNSHENDDEPEPAEVKQDVKQDVEPAPVTKDEAVQRGDENA